VFGRVATALRVDPVLLPARKGAPEKVRLAALMRATTSVSNGWLARKLQMGKPATVSQYLRRFRLAQGHQTREFQRLWSIVKGVLPKSC
jgi:hypothetical protein